MGQSNSVPQEVQNQPKDQKAITVTVLYCAQQGGQDEANFVSQVIKTVYHNANVKLFTSDVANTLEINYDGREIYSKINGYGPFTDKSAVGLIKDLKELTNQ